MRIRPWQLLLLLVVVLSALSLWHKPEPALRMLELALEYGYDDEPNQGLPWP